MWENPTCFMCDDPVQVDSPNVFGPEYHTFSCRRCGQYGVSVHLLRAPDMPSDLRACISAATRQAHESGRPILLKRGNLASIAAPHQNVRVLDKVEKVLQHIAAKCGRPGSAAAVDSTFDFPVADCVDFRELEAYLSHLLKKGLIESVAVYQSNAPAYAPTIDGWEYLEPRSPIGGIPGQCFVAMSFAKWLDDAYALGIKPAIEDCGFKAICMKEVATNEGITDRILSEIRRAEFVVADFTGQRRGVYFEAGFARGLGRPVIGTCRRNAVSKLHFDIKHLGHVLWDAPTDLRTSLAESIRANIIPSK
jgi:hypothetical protein